MIIKTMCLDILPISLYVNFVYINPLKKNAKKNHGPKAVVFLSYRMGLFALKF